MKLTPETNTPHLERQFSSVAMRRCSRHFDNFVIREPNELAGSRRLVLVDLSDKGLANWSDKIDEFKATRRNQTTTMD